MNIKSVNDTDFRHALTERFLDCDTTVEEEQALARFYRECKQKGCVPDGESEICEIVTATVQINDATIQPQIANTTSTARPRHSILRWLAAACIAVAAVCGTVVAFHDNSGKPTLALNKKAMKAEPREVSKDTAVIAVPDNEMVVAQNADRNMVKPKSNAHGNPAVAAQEQQSTPVTTPTASSSSASTSEIARLYDMALDTFGDASNITIERKGDVLLLSVVSAGGNTERYAVAVSDGEEPMFVAL